MVVITGEIVQEMGNASLTVAKLLPLQASYPFLISYPLTSPFPVP